MPTYHNAYTVLSDVREGINEYSSEKVQATDTSGAYTNAWLMTQINKAQKYIYNWLLIRIPEVFLEYEDLTGVSSVFTLPADFGVLKIFTDDNYRKVHEIKADQLKLKETTGSDRLYYRKGNTLVLDKAGITDTYRLWFYRKARDLNQGKASAADTLASTAAVTADYYNGMIIEDITGTQAATITDYSTGRVITSTITLANESFYGIVSDLPEPFHYLIAPKAILYVKQSIQSQEKPSNREIDDFNEDFTSVYRAYAKTLDFNVSEMFTDFGMGRVSGIVND